MKFTDKQYDILKWLAQIVLPALGTLYFALSTIWGLPKGEEVVGTITAIDAFLGAILGLSTSQYNKSGKDGRIVIDETNSDKDIYRMEFNGDPAGIKDKSQVTFVVKKTDGHNGSY